MFADASQHAHWHQIALWIGWSVNAILVVIVIVLAFQVRQCTDAPEKAFVAHGTENNPCLENVTHVRRYLCKPPDNHTTDNSSCNLCPHNWFLHKNKCYWTSKDKQTWHKSKEACKEKLSQLMMIQNQEEVAFIQNISKANLLWIGLEATSPERKWTWVDGSFPDKKLLRELGPFKAI